MLISGVTLYLNSTVVSYFIIVILIMNMRSCCRAVHISTQFFTSHIAASQDHSIPPIDCDGILYKTRIDITSYHCTIIFVCLFVC